MLCIDPGFQHCHLGTRCRSAVLAERPAQRQLWGQQCRRVSPLRSRSLACSSSAPLQQVLLLKPAWQELDPFVGKEWPVVVETPQVTYMRL